LKGESRMNDKAFKKLLIVDDEAITACEKTDALKKFGIDAIYVNSGEKAVQAVKSDPEIAIVLMDISLGRGMNGHEAAQAILELRDLPIIFLTSHSDKEIVNNARDLPGYGYVTKDSSDDMLVSSIEMACRLFECQKRIKENEERYHSLFSTMLEGLAFHQIICDDCGRPVDYRFLEMNPAFEALTGLKASDLTGRTVLEALPGIEHDWIERCGQVALTGRSERFISYSSPLGKWFEVSAYQTEPGYFATFFVDITHRKLSEEELRKSEERYRDLFENAPNAYFSVGTDGLIIRCNKGAEKLLGYKKEKLIGMPVIALYADTPHGKEKAQQVLERFRNNITTTGELQMQRSDGSLIWVSLTVNPVVDNEGRVTESRSSVYDITDRREAEAALRENEEKFRTAFNTSPDIISIIRVRDGVFVDVNEKFVEITGFTRDEILGKPAYASGLWVDQNDQERVQAELKQHGYMDNLEVQFRMKDNRIIHSLLSARVTSISGIPHILSIAKNIDDLKGAEKERLRLVTAIEQSAETIVITDNSGTIVYVNPAFEKITGYTREESIGANPRILKSGYQDNSFYKSMWETLTRGDVWSGYMINRKKDGSFFEEEATLSPVKDESGAIVNYVAVKRDITREMTLQKQLLHAQKMEAIGTLAGGIAHDFNNILQIIMGFSEILLQGEKEGTPEDSDLQRIMDAAKNGAELVKGLLTFSRKVEPEFIPLNINSKVQLAVKILEHTLPKMIHLQTELSDDIWEISADPTQVEQILMNLALNARDAMPEGGRLTFSTRNITLDAKNCRFILGCLHGDYVQLTVSDTGHGMEKETAEHIFEPFFTTKELGSGTGLGLAIVYGIVQQHGGFIECITMQGRGTAFEIYFKALKVVTEHETKENGLSSATSGTETILFVDDEESVRKMGDRILREMGYVVLLAGNGKEAFDLALKASENISLVILDLSMPEMGGMDCLVKLLAAIPGIKILIMSGYATDADPEEYLKMGAKGFISKPFRINELLEKVRAILDNS